jgi:predicted nucleotidyltransferase
MVLNPDFREFLCLLNEHEVKYLVVGGYAVAFHGHPRYTKDLDIWIWVDPTNATKMVDVLQAFGFASIGLSKEDFLNAENVFQLGYPPVRIDLAMSISGVDFESSFENKLEIEVDGIKLNVIGLDDLKTNKRASGRMIDMADVESLTKKSD